MKLLPVLNPPNPWASSQTEYVEGEAPSAGLDVYEDRSRSILSNNDSPDVGFRFSVNPYRGCFHACAYCYARPSHEYLSFGAGTDFERKIVVKKHAPELLKEAFDKPSWKGDVVVFSGVTDCYQPLENSYRLTRGCLEVCVNYKNPVGIITKSPLVERDIDLLAELAKHGAASVHVSIPFWNEENARAIEPFVTTPARRMRIIERLATAGIPVGVSVSPIIPGLNDVDAPEVLRRAADAGATRAFWVLLRLPGPVEAVFEERVRKAFPLRAEKIFRRLREAHGGKVYNPRFGERQRGHGPFVESFEKLFTATAARVGLSPHEDHGARTPSPFQRPTPQLSLFLR